ncbi:MAG: restriction endonuclease subunit S [Oscillospiraceae bacterium]
MEKVKEARFEEIELSKYLLQKGDLLICEGGDVGRSSVWEHDVTMYYQNALHRVRFYQNINPYFYKYLIECYKGIGIIDRFSKGVTIKHLVQNSLNAMWLPLPPLAEQKRIVAKIEELLPYIERYEQAWSKLEQFNSRFPEDMKKSLLQYAIQGKLVEQRLEEGTAEELFAQIQEEKQRLIAQKKIKKEKPLPEITEDEKPFDIPESWKWVRFSDLMNAMSTGPFGSMLHKSDYVPKGTPLVNPANIVNGKIIPSEKMMVSADTAKRLESYTLYTGMIVIGRRGEMGRCAVVSENENGWICGTGSFFLTPSSSLFVDYIQILFTTHYAKAYLGGESVGTTMSNLNHKILSKMPVPLPPLVEQKRIVQKLEQLLPLCERLK